MAQNLPTLPLTFDDELSLAGGNIAFMKINIEHELQCNPNCSDVTKRQARSLIDLADAVISEIKTIVDAGGDNITLEERVAINSKIEDAGYKLSTFVLGG